MGWHLFAGFALAAEAAGTKVWSARGAGELVESVATALSDLRGGDILVPSSQHSVIEDVGLRQALEAQGFSVIAPSGLSTHAEKAPVGLTIVDGAVAETGSIFHDATDYESRLASTLPPIHVAVVPLTGLVRDYGTLFAGISEGGQPPSYLALITGPSRTADIERVLTIGVHGPSELIVIVSDLPSLTGVSKAAKASRADKGQSERALGDDTSA